MLGLTPAEKAYLGPFAAFLLCLLVGEVVRDVCEGAAAWPLAEPQYWLFPLQTLLCGALLVKWWRRYPLHWPAGVAWAVLAGVVVFFLWIAPQAVLHRAPRLEGFNPWFFAGSAAQGVESAFRFARLVIVVPLLEEIFWRGYLYRWLIYHDFEQVPIGTFGMKAFAITTVGFCLEHQMADWPAALLAGALYNEVATVSRSLSACVLAHALTNLLLGLYVMRTGQWGYW